MTREKAKKILRSWDGVYIGYSSDEVEEAHNMAIQALSQEPCELLIIKSDIFLHQDDRKKWMESIKREKENGVIILPPYFEPLLVPNDIEINIEQEPCDDVISREAVIMECIKYADHENNVRFKKEVSERRKHDAQVIVYVCDYFKTFVEKLPSVNPQEPKTGHWIKDDITERSKSAYKHKCDRCGAYHRAMYDYCPSCGAKMIDPQESEVKE